MSWLRLAGLYFENTAYSAATVVAIFMAGLALGSYLAGRVARRTGDLFLLYFSLEASIGLIALVMPWLFIVVRPVFGVIYQIAYDYQPAYHLLRIALSAMLMLPPAVLMGITLPVLIQALTRKHRALARRAGILYGLNSAGAALGAAMAGFVLLPRLGTLGSTMVGVCINIAVAVAGWLVLGCFPWPNKLLARREEEREGVPLATRSYIMAALLFSGFCALCYEIIWTRLLVASIGPASYSFATVLSCFILGLALGSWVYAAISPRIKSDVLACGVLIILTGLAAASATYFLPRLPAQASRLISRSQDSFHALVAVKYLLAGIVILPLTIFSGALFPAAASAYVPDVSRLSERMGRLYAANSVGSIAGSLIAGFALLPRLGAHRAALPIIVLQFAVGLYVIARSRGFNWLLYLLPAPAVAIFILFSRPAVDPQLLYGGGYIYFWQYKETRGQALPVSRYNLLYHKDGPGGTVTVTSTPDGSSTHLAIDGKIDGSDDPADMMTQSMLAHLPLVLHPDPRDVLIIGLGTGTTYAKALAYPVDAVTCVEISEEVIEAARFFHHAYDSTRMWDERGRITIGDGRSFMFFDEDEFDVIIAEPSNPWLSGMGNLFTVEYFSAMRERLRDGGICCQWLHGYRLSPLTFKSVIKTFTTAFPQASLWWVNITGGDFLLIGSESRHTVSLAELDAAISEYGIGNLLHPEGKMSPYSFLRRFVAAGDDLRQYAKPGRVATDDSAFLEYTASREMYSRLMDELHRELARLSQPAFDVLDEKDRSDPEIRARMVLYEDNRRAFIEFIYARVPEHPWNHGIYLAKRNAWLGDEDISIAVAESMTGYAERMYADALLMPRGPERTAQMRSILHGYTEALAFAAPRATDYENIAVLYRELGDDESALAALNAALERGRESAGIYDLKAGLLYAMAKGEMALAEDGSQSKAESREHAFAAMELLRQSADAYRRATELEPAVADHWLNLGAVMKSLGDHESARRAWQRVLALDPRHEGARRALAALER